MRGAVEAGRARSAITRRARGLNGAGTALTRRVLKRASAGMVLLALGVALAVAGITLAAVGGGSSAVRGQASAGAGSAGGQGAKSQPLAAPGTLYRIVGCRSHGTGPYSHGPARREVALALDDGPARLTPAFLAMLERLGVPATFFMVGREISPRDRGLLLRELDDGDALGDHTFNHADLTKSRRAHGELAATLARIQALSGYTPCVMRPPYGAWDRRVLRQARALGLATVMWNVDPDDWSRPGAHAIAHRVLAQVKPGSIVISHDGGGPRGQTLAAYPAVIHVLRRRGYRFLTVPDLLGFRPVYRRCIQLCDNLGRPRRELPANAIILPS